MIAVVLAAGRGTRMGHPKLHLSWGETTILGQVLRTLRAAGIRDIVVAVRPADDAAAAAARDVGAEVAPTAGDADAPTRSLQAALAHIAARRGNDAVAPILVMPGDMPLVEPATVKALIAVFHAGADPRRSIVAPVLRDRRGHPVIFGAAHVPALAALGEAERPRLVVERAGERLRLVLVEDVGVVTDIDDAAAYEKWRPR